MPELDLIPSDYRRRARLKRKVLRFGMVCAGVAGFMVSSHVAMGLLLSGVRSDVARLQDQQRIATEQREELGRRQARKETFEHQLKLLQGLRSGAAAEKMFITMDRALQGDDVWFTSWEFQRAGEVVEEGPRTVNTGYFIVVPAGEGRKKKETWKIETHMTIRGQAKDHAALSRFVRRLTGQPEIHDVRVLRTARRKQADVQVVEFDMAVVVNSGAVTG